MTRPTDGATRHARNNAIRSVVFSGCDRVHGEESPEWHREVLEERERRIASGEARFSDWEQAKADIRKRVSGD